MPFDDNDPRLGYMVILRVFLEVVTDGRVLRHSNILIEDDPAEFRPPSYVAVVEDDTIFNQSAGVYANAAS
jgi:hypothetical protein